MDAIPYRPAQPAFPAAAGNAAVEAVPEQLPVPEVPAVVPTTPESYGWKEAALDTLISQYPDNVWRQKILTGRLDFNEAVDYRMRHLSAKVQGKELALGAKPNTTLSEPVDRVEQRETF